MGQMAWLYGQSPKYRILHLNVDGSGWRSYTHFQRYSVPDYKEKGGSKGWATYQKLRQAGWELVETAVAENMRNPALVAVGDGGR
jgi:hypothetical protein